MTSPILIATDTTLLLPLRVGEMALAGLIWHPLPSPQKLLVQTQQLLRQEQCHSFVIHQYNDKAQCGITANLPKHGSYYSAALLLMEQLGANWVAVFELQDQRYLLIGVAEGQVVPGCDVLLQHFSNEVS